MFLFTESPQLKVLWAAEKGRVDLVREMLDEDESLANARDPDGYSPLHRASYEGHLSVVRVRLACMLIETSHERFVVLQLLLDRGVDVDCRTNDGWTPLHSASRWGQFAVVEELLSRGADINAQTNGQLTALHLASADTQKDSEQTLQVLLKQTNVDLTLTNKVGETAHTVALRCSKFAHLFDPYVNSS